MIGRIMRQCHMNEFVKLTDVTNCGLRAAIWWRFLKLCTNDFLKQRGVASGFSAMLFM